MVMKFFAALFMTLPAQDRPHAPRVVSAKTRFLNGLFASMTMADAPHKTALLPRGVTPLLLQSVVRVAPVVALTPVWAFALVISASKR